MPNPVANSLNVVEPQEAVNGSRFIAMPLWLYESGASANAVFVYGILQSYCKGRSGAVWPGRKNLKEKFGISTARLDRSLDELEKIGAITSVPWLRPNGSHTSTVHFVWADPPIEGVERHLPAIDREGKPANPSHHIRVEVSSHTSRPIITGDDRSHQNHDTQNKTQLIRPKDQDPVKEATSSQPLWINPDAIRLHGGVRSTEAGRIIRKAIEGSDRLTESEAKKVRQLKSNVDEWLSVGYESELIVKAIIASPFKTANAIGGELRKSSKPPPDAPKSWSVIGDMYQQALTEESK